MSNRSIAIGCLAVALVLAALPLYPAAFVGPIDSDLQAAHHVAHESTEAYDEQTRWFQSPRGQSTDVATVQYHELSPEARSMFDRARESSATDSGLRTYDPDICRDGVLHCPGLTTDSYAPEFDYERQASREENVLLVEADDGRYVFWLDYREWGFYQYVQLYVLVGLVIAYAGFLAAYGAGLTPGSTPRRAATALVGLGVGGLGVAFAEGLLLVGAVLVGVAVPIASISPVADRSRDRAIAGLLGVVVAALSVVVPHLDPVVEPELTGLGTFVAVPGIALVGAAWLVRRTLGDAARREPEAPFARRK